MKGPQLTPYSPDNNGRNDDDMRVLEINANVGDVIEINKTN